MNRVLTICARCGFGPYDESRPHIHREHHRVHAPGRSVYGTTICATCNFGPYVETEAEDRAMHREFHRRHVSPPTSGTRSA